MVMGKTDTTANPVVVSPDSTINIHPSDADNSPRPIHRNRKERRKTKAHPKGSTARNPRR